MRFVTVTRQFDDQVLFPLPICHSAKQFVFVLHYFLCYIRFIRMGQTLLERYCSPPLGLMLHICYLDMIYKKSHFYTLVILKMSVMWAGEPDSEGIHGVRF